MFDRKVRTLVNLYVGLVATRRVLTPALRTLFSQRAASAGLEEQAAKVREPGVRAFYTFEYTYFSERQLWQYENGGLERTSDNYNQVAWTPDPEGFYVEGQPYSEPPSRKAVGHVDDGSDPYAGMSRQQFEGLRARARGQGARRRGAPARAADLGPIDTAEAVTVDVKIEWVDCARCVGRATTTLLQRASPALWSGGVEAATQASMPTTARSSSGRRSTCRGFATGSSPATRCGHVMRTTVTTTRSTR